ncbi:hypothetical protein CC1G_13594 [Coprinopsis cinerea okayama7|uniref:DUF4470 domain-containing protein n=1 Tax=Coprinopsis cinerea (strain Okayama-7 / 130 / ATCC MYA-4618 / FGSC 9003) TaxID=240176 RepID=D6RJU1_COPC7|nr:hypothetical protein CC1G_13594 [Coprinopsis cinerea okayama7\|eukprot:XP_002912061.1 hypothetical protein CC1G_13594 [Coprinopsis cinerea okayama7\
MAEEWNENGSQAYREGNLARAKEFYQKAARIGSKHASTEPKYFSNLSAVLFELGEYEECMKAITKSWTILKHGGTSLESSPLAIKLATRYAKSYYYAREPSRVKVHEDIKKFAKGVSGNDQDEKAKEISFWWKFIESGAREYSPREDELDRARRTSIFKTRQLPTKELYHFGHDAVRSLLDGLEHDPSTEMKQSDLDPSEKKRLAFLFGGSGDARHVFGTVLHAANSGWNNKWHMTLIEIHPATVARNVLVFELFTEIQGARTEEEKDELFASLVYLYTSMAIPDYCVQRLMKTAAAAAERLRASAQGEGPVILHGHLSIDRSSVPEILVVLKQWCQPIEKSVATMMKYNPVIKEPVGEKLTERLEQFDAMFRGQVGFDPNEDTELERRLIDETRALIPPATLINRHPAFLKLHTTRKPTLKAVREEVLKTWKPNFALFQNVTTYGQRLGLFDEGYPENDQNPQDNLSSFFYMCIRFSKHHQMMELMSVPRTVFYVFKQFFIRVIAALRALRGKLVVEIAVDDVITGLPRIFADSSRPKTYPNKFTRMWLSNVPDYTGGTLNNAVFLIPHLHRSKSNMIMSNILLNTSAFTVVPEVTYNYVLLEEKDLQRFLGCRHMQPTAEFSAWRDLALVADMDGARDASALPSKAELHAWLSHLLLSTVKPAHALGAPRRVDQPNNLAAFVHLLIYLHEHMAFPAHWLADFVAAVFDNCLVTAKKPYCGFLPIPLSHAKDVKAKPEKVNLEFWKSDLRLVFSDLHPLVRFPIRHILPDDRVLQDADMVHLKTRVTENIGAYIPPPHSDMSFVNAIGLAFYKLRKNASIKSILAERGLLKALNMSKEEVERTMGSVQIMLSEGYIDVIEDECKTWRWEDKRLMPPAFINWRMAKEDYEKMRREKWEMVLYRTDVGLVMTEPARASDWIAVET